MLKVSASVMLWEKGERVQVQVQVEMIDAPWSGCPVCLWSRTDLHSEIVVVGGCLGYGLVC